MQLRPYLAPRASDIYHLALCQPLKRHLNTKARSGFLCQYVISSTGLSPQEATLGGV